MPVPIQTPNQESGTKLNSSADSSAHSKRPDTTDSTTNMGAPRINADDDRRRERERIEQLYEERMEEEYAKREGGA
ncbi:hypothetical protein POJ06DRAFT_268353 [Lipomyces tetrasporus]|uniref:Uncharacterized protein n=1 Tax=Lipomyces tetrasporus TaxID=54092 RepID=A0AAD7QT05_9ASCO|nr:uncharacterized protein POJ06DRAFT_268353 [Lipomyces tetrasporus]KAJ8100773.1 hypothetical protein POJ06DRAFT_268353 [Lipomyces tetrasporus]